MNYVCGRQHNGTRNISHPSNLGVCHLILATWEYATEMAKGSLQM